MTAIISAVINSIVQGILGFVGAFFQKKADQQQGAEAQAAKETAQTATVEQKIAEAEANAPRTDAAIEERLKNGTF